MWALCPWSGKHYPCRCLARLEQTIANISLHQRMAFVRQRMQEQGLPVDEAPDDDEIRETYNFAPGYNGAVYRGDTPDRGYDESQSSGRDDGDGDDDIGIDIDKEEEDTTQERGQYGSSSSSSDKRLNPQGAVKQKSDTKYKIQKMRWGLIPFWTKRQPDYGSMMRTINCRDDSLIEDKGMWTSMKRRKRCVIICQGFYEWLKKGPGGKVKVPHFTKRKDGDLMYFAGLWDCVQYEGLYFSLRKHLFNLFIFLPQKFQVKCFDRVRREIIYVHHHHDRLQLISKIPS